MHPRNPYKDRQPNFQHLAQLYPDTFGKHVINDSKGRPAIDFQDAEASRCLTETLLLHDFSIKAALKEDRLVPAIPNRLNYLLWIQDLLDSTLPSLENEQKIASDSTKSLSKDAANPMLSQEIDRPSKKRKLSGSERSTSPWTIDQNNVQNIKGLDIGTGASAIYPLLGCALRPNWTFTGTDIDLESIKNSQSILDSNVPGLSSTTSKADSSSSTEPQSEHSKLKAPLNLREKIMLLHRTESDPLMPILEPNHFPEISEEDSGDLLYHFTMCNPPFFESEAEVQKGRENKVLDPRGICLASNSELITPGGEVQFIDRMIQESLTPELKERVLWFTSMVGKLSSLVEVVQKIKAIGIDNYAITELVQGQTKRWAVAWSFKGWRLEDKLARPSTSSLSNLIPPSTRTIRVLDLSKASKSTEITAAHESTHQESNSAADKPGYETVVSKFLNALNSIHDSKVSSSSASTNHNSKQKWRFSLYSESWTRSARRKRIKELKEAEDSRNEEFDSKSQEGGRHPRSQRSSYTPFLIVDFELEETIESKDEDSKSRVRLTAVWQFGKVQEEEKVEVGMGNSVVEARRNGKQEKKVDLSQSWRGLVDHVCRWVEGKE